MKESAHRMPVAMAPPHPEFDRKFAYIAYGLLFILIAFFTYIHYFQPQILRVPDNADVSRWQNPAFEESCIYDRMTEAEKEKVRKEGIPLRAAPNMVFAELFSLALGLLCFFHARKYYGSWMASCFLIGSFAFTGIQESMWILIGRFHLEGLLAALGSNVHGTYWFPKGGLWFIETPTFVCVAWFYIAYSCVAAAGRVFPGTGLIGRAAIGGLMAVIFDLWEDPVATSPELLNWVWAKGDYLLLLGIPHYNFMGWFLLIFTFAIFWEWLPKLEKKWGRPKATVIFFLILIAADALILLSILAVCGLGKVVLAGMGVDHIIQIPPGW